MRILVAESIGLLQAEAHDRLVISRHSDAALHHVLIA
jgi:hypothetical protein